MTDRSLEREMRLQRYLDGELSPRESAAFEKEVLASDELSDDLIDELSLRELIEARRQRARRGQRTPALRARRWIYPAVAAAAALLLFLWPGGEDTRSPVFRGDDGDMVIALEPLGELQEPPRTFRWRSMAEAESYRLELFDSQAQRVLMESVADTAFVAAEAAPMPSSGFWQITPIDKLGMPGNRSIPFRFTVRP